MNQNEAQTKKSIFETPLLSSKVKSANVKMFPEAALGYLVGPMLALIANGIVNTYLLQYWDKVLGLGTWAPLFETLLPIFSAIIIVIGNLLVGKLMERKPSIAGKARPLILIGMPLIAIALLALFLVPFPSGATLQSPNITSMIVIAIGYNLYYAIAYPFYYTSHSSLVNLSTRDSSKRSLLATASNAAQLAAAGLAGMVGPFIVDALDLLAKDGTETAREAANGKWFILMIIMIVCLVLGCLIEYFFTRERITEETVKLQRASDLEGAAPAETKKISTSEQIKICVHDKYWWLIIIFYFLYQLGGMLKNNDASWFSQSFFNGEIGLAGTISIVGAIPTAVGMVFIWPLANKFGKANCIKVGALAAAILGCLGFLCIPFADNGSAVTVIAIAGFCLKALGTIPAMYISLALLADVLDHQEALYGKRTDGFTMAVYGSIMVAMTGIANGIIAGLNALVEDYSQASQVLNTFLFFGGEILCYLIIFVMFNFMNVEKFSKFDHDAIAADQKAKAEAEGREWIDPAIRLEQEQAESEKLAEEEALKELQKKCEKQGLNFETEKQAYFTKQQETKAANDAKAKAAEEKKAAALAEKKKKEDEKLASMSEAQRAAYDKKIADKKQKELDDIEKTRVEFERLREETKAYREAA